MKRIYFVKKMEDVDFKAMSKKEALEALNARFSFSFKGIKELEELGDKLYVTYKNNRTLVFKNCFGSYGFPVEFV